MTGTLLHGCNIVMAVTRLLHCCIAVTVLHGCYIVGDRVAADHGGPEAPRGRLHMHRTEQVRCAAGQRQSQRGGG